MPPSLRLIQKSFGARKASLTVPQAGRLAVCARSTNCTLVRWSSMLMLGFQKQTLAAGLTFLYLYVFFAWAEWVCMGWEARVRTLICAILAVRSNPESPRQATSNTLAFFSRHLAERLWVFCLPNGTLAWLSVLVALRNTSKHTQSSRSPHKATEARTMQQKPKPSNRSPHQAAEAHTKQ